jgi:hypothetical protein
VIEAEKQANPKAHKIYVDTRRLAEDLIKFYSGLDYSEEAILRKHYGYFNWVAFSKFVDNA